MTDAFASLRKKQKIDSNASSIADFILDYNQTTARLAAVRQSMRDLPDGFSLYDWANAAGRNIQSMADRSITEGVPFYERVTNLPGSIADIVDRNRVFTSEDDLRNIFNQGPRPPPMTRNDLWTAVLDEQRLGSTPTDLRNFSIEEQVAYYEMTGLYNGERLTFPSMRLDLDTTSWSPEFDAYIGGAESRELLEAKAIEYGEELPFWPNWAEALGGEADLYAAYSNRIRDPSMFEVAVDNLANLPNRISNLYNEYRYGSIASDVASEVGTIATEAYDIGLVGSAAAGAVTTYATGSYGAGTLAAGGYRVMAGTIMPEATIATRAVPIGLARGFGAVADQARRLVTSASSYINNTDTFVGRAFTSGRQFAGAAGRVASTFTEALGYVAAGYTVAETLDNTFGFTQAARDRAQFGKDMAARFPHVVGSSFSAYNPNMWTGGPGNSDSFWSTILTSLDGSWGGPQEAAAGGIRNDAQFGRFLKAVSKSDDPDLSRYFYMRPDLGADWYTDPDNRVAISYENYQEAIRMGAEDSLLYGFDVKRPTRSYSASNLLDVLSNGGSDFNRYLTEDVYLTSSEFSALMQSNPNPALLEHVYVAPTDLRSRISPVTIERFRQAVNDGNYSKLTPDSFGHVSVADYTKIDPAKLNPITASRLRVSSELPDTYAEFVTQRSAYEDLGFVSGLDDISNMSDFVLGNYAGSYTQFLDTLDQSQQISLVSSFHNTDLSSLVTDYFRYNQNETSTVAGGP